MQVKTITALLRHELVQGINRFRFAQMERKTVPVRGDLEAQRHFVAGFQPRDLPQIYLNQRWPEFSQLLKMITAERHPRTILEIGTGRGGTSYFFSRLLAPCDVLVTVDIEPVASQLVNIFKNRRSCRVTSITGNSLDQRTITAVRSALGRSVDVLFIDGDHTYAGVSKDFALYQTLCSPNAHICFHDVQPDWEVTKGIITDARSGDVWKFWAEIKARYESYEFIEDPDQNGFGIGVIRNRPSQRNRT